MNTPIEIWLPIIGCEGIYEISSLGRVRALARKRQDGRFYRERVMKLNGRIYLQVHLRLRKKQPQPLVHHLVLEAFRGPCPPGLQACHEDGNSKNNSISNLRWDTCLSNNQDKEKHGTKLLGEKHPNHKLTQKQVKKIKSLSSDGLSQWEIARIFQLKSHRSIGRILRGESWCQK